ncbi:hypothetical protein BB560_000839 [Smittium megazygosporum]|uniref:CDP-diacylglycerol--glycerol-3-phosphate 3-phosphatidyltransferase n=1 Tax=Smittium megazygosporum TaxID=133381 RepID=A0A2T9ZJ94_9FUNG|nr:hypothetical protein BB560_000839 [Smittium megazygosporum]
MNQDVFAKLGALSTNKTTFLCKSEDIEILESPSDFYETLKSNIKAAKKRIVISTLYIGNTESELIQTISESLSSNPDTVLTILVDYLRGTRIEKNGESTISSLNSLLQKFGPQRVQIFMYHTPDLSGISKKIYPQRLNETVGVMHIKAYVTDDSVIISGANLSRDYFTNRQDRYFSFSRASGLADYLSHLVSSISRFSFFCSNPLVKKVGDNNIVLGDGCPSPYKTPSLFRKYANEIIQGFHSQWFLKTNQGSSINKFFSELLNSEFDTVVIPTLQMNPLKIIEDKLHTELLFDIFNNLSESKGHSKLDITSAYFNFANLHTNAILKSKGMFNIIIASPQANGFYGASGISKYIPHAYTMFELQFMERLKRRNRLEEVKLFEYHRKGMWYFFEDKDPVMTVIGSSNLGERSLNKDLEAQFTLITKSSNFQSRLSKPSLKGKVLFITGASRGIGEAIAVRAAQDGAKIAVVAKTTDPHPTLPGTIYTTVESIKKAGGDAIGIACDIRDENQVKAAIEKTVKTFGGIDIVVNNASAIFLKGTEDTPVSRFDLMNTINARGAWMVTKYALPYLKKSSNPHILTLSPPLNMHPKWFGANPAYTMSKYGMSMCTVGFSEEFKKYGIAANSLWPLTTIETAALIIVATKQSKLVSRNCQIMADAAHLILTKKSSECTGKFFIDETLLRQNGETDFEKYSIIPGTKDNEFSLDGYLDTEQFEELAKARKLSKL